MLSGHIPMAPIPFYKGAVFYHKIVLSKTYQNATIGLGPTSPVAARVPSLDTSMAVKSSPWQSKNVWVFTSSLMSKTIPTAAVW